MIVLCVLCWWVGRCWLGFLIREGEGVGGVVCGSCSC